MRAIQFFSDLSIPATGIPREIITPTSNPNWSVLSQEVYNIYVKHISTHIKHAAINVRQTERGELMKYFCDKLNSSRKMDGLQPISMGRMGRMLEKIPTKDLYYLKKVCDDAQNFSKKFWFELNPEKYKK